MIEIKHLELVRAIAETGSMTKASQKLFLTQPSLSHQLKEIESRLGISLFLRVNKSMVLTPQGRRMLEVGRDVLLKMDSLEQEIKPNQNASQQLRITTQCYTCYHWLPTLMQKFQSMIPTTEIDIVTEAMSSPIEFLLKGQIDLAVTNQLKATNGIKFEKLFDDEQVVLVPAKHPLAAKQIIFPADFTDQRYIIYKEDLASDYFAQNVLIPKGVQVGKVTKMQLTEARVELVKAGMGLAVLSRWLVKPFIRDNKSIRLIPIGKKGFYRTWYIATLDQKKSDPVIKLFTSFLKEQQLGVN
ncbi:MAG TPA: LysR family transcriptional regulator [Chryseosolibacter sp.]|nr:LysR family transcriptional regulator [Chryseosolibacter sp.]